jgi:putative SOS response-associated peptidase YedK
MPAILKLSDYNSRLKSSFSQAKQLLSPAQEDLMSIHEVAPLVNDTKNN